MPIKRRVFFSFHFADIMRVNNVRKAWRYHNPGSILVPSFTDSSLWESKQLEKEETLKALIRDGVANTSTVCVLVGTETWQRRWVKYEIARAVIDKKGLLAVHINGIKHDKRLLADPYGHNPLDFIGIGVENQGKYFLFEKVWRQTSIFSQEGFWDWSRYQDYTLSVPLPPYLPKPLPGERVQLSRGTQLRCFMSENGAKNIGLWVDAAAQVAGR
jgi:hypothetical protein